MSNKLSASGIVYSDHAKLHLNRLSQADQQGIRSALKQQAPIAFDSANKVRCKDGDDPVYRCKFHPRQHPHGGVRALYVARNWKDSLVMLVVGIFNRDANPYGDGH